MSRHGAEGSSTSSATLQLCFSYLVQPGLYESSGNAWHPRHSTNGLLKTAEQEQEGASSGFVTLKQKIKAHRLM